MARKAAFKFHKLLVAEPALSPDARARELYPKAERHAGHGAARAPSKTTHPTEPRSQLQRVRRNRGFRGSWWQDLGRRSCISLHKAGPGCGCGSRASRPPAQPGPYGAWRCTRGYFKPVLATKGLKLTPSGIFNQSTIIATTKMKTKL